MTAQLLNRRVVTIGGGTGGFILNRGLHAYPVHQTAVCTAFDSGGSSGSLRDEFGALPQGDIRRCMLAMAGQDTETIRQLFEYRFPAGNGHSTLAEHSLGNLVLFAAEKLYGHVEGIRRMSDLLGVKGQILPVSIDNAELCAELSDGTRIRGESKIDLRPLDDDRLVKRVWLEPRANIIRPVAEAIQAADVVVLGPGDLYTSVIPNLLVAGMGEALGQSKARIVYVSNLMTKWSETRGFDAADFVEEILRYGIGRDRLDAVLVNTKPIPSRLLPHYAKTDRSEPVKCTGQVIRRLKKLTRRVIVGDFLSQSNLAKDLIRHGPGRLAKCIVELEL